MKIGNTKIEFNFGSSKLDRNYPVAFGKQKLKIGRFYNVICVKTKSDRFGNKLETLLAPTLGKPHIDEYEVDPGNPINGHLHWHIDMRFASDDDIRTMRWDFGFQWALSIGANNGLTKYDLEQNQTAVLHCHWKVMEMKRDFPLTICDNPSRWSFANHYEDAVLDEKMKCPHHGFDLRSEPTRIIDNKECIVCPGHKLCFEKSTGKLIGAR